MEVGVLGCIGYRESDNHWMRQFGIEAEEFQLGNIALVEYPNIANAP
jgi:hypothetical protein